jgi:glycosyltransferase involved in cell wall biosynthesis
MNMKFAIIIATYQRPDGLTPLYLRRAMDAVLNQNHKDFKLYVIGDKYEDNEEFMKLVKSYEGHLDLYYENLPFAIEREKYGNDKEAVWCTAGTNLVNYAIDKAVKEGIDYICHLDHDDYWDKNHLQEINDAVEKTSAVWLCTRSVYGNLVYPVGDYEDHLVPFLPLAGGLVHSAVCCNYRKIDLRYRDTYVEGGNKRPSDADLWDRLKEYITNNGLTSILINKLTCYHHDEGYHKL